MPTRVFATAEFARFSKKARIADEVLVGAIDRIDRGLVDADLGGGLFKMRIGRRGAYRTIVAFVRNRRAFFLFGYAKQDMENIGPAAERALRAFGVDLQEASDQAVARLVDGGDLREIER